MNCPQCAYESLNENEMERQGYTYCRSCGCVWTRWQTEEISRLRNILTGLVDKLQQIHDNKQYKAIWNLAMAHGVVYEGPNYENELKDAKALLEGK